MRRLVLSATGHRPSKLGGYSPAISKRLIILATAYLKVIEPTRVVSGMALGWDLAVAQAALNLNIPLTCAIPFPSQPSLWPLDALQRWKAIKDRSRDVVIIAQEYSPKAMQDRNVFMVRQCHVLLALWDGSRGGTRNCVLYAQRLRAFKPALFPIEIINTWESFKKMEARHANPTV